MGAGYSGFSNDQTSQPKYYVYTVNYDMYTEM